MPRNGPVILLKKILCHELMTECEQRHLVGCQTIHGFHLPVCQQALSQDVIPERIDVIKCQLKKVLAAHIQGARRPLVLQADDFQKPVVLFQVEAKLLVLEPLRNVLAPVLLKSKLQQALGRKNSETLYLGLTR